jgi:hypothetical protein
MKIKYRLVLPMVTALILSGVSLAHAQNFTGNLHFGLQNNPQVTQLQEFLTAQGLYSGPVTGNFYSLTMSAVKAFQTQRGISPASGYFGPLTIAAANEIIATTAETSVPPAQALSAAAKLEIQTLLQEVAQLQQQLQLSESSTAPVATQNIQPSVQQQPQIVPPVQQNTTTTPAPVSVPAQISVSPTPYGFSWTPAGATSNRGKTTNDEIADVTFNPGNGTILLNSMTITFSGTAASSTGFLSGVKLLDPSGNTVSVSGQTADCSGSGTCSVTFNFNSRLDSGAQMYKVIVDDSKAAVASGNNSMSLYATIAAPADVSYYDAPTGGSLVSLPAVLQPGNQIFPLNLNSVTYAQGS